MAQLWGYWYLVDGVKALDSGNAETQRDGGRRLPRNAVPRPPAVEARRHNHYWFLWRDFLGEFAQVMFQ